MDIFDYIKRNIVKLLIVGTLIGVAIVSLFVRKNITYKDVILKTVAGVLLFIAGYLFGSYNCDSCPNDVQIVEKEVIIDTCITYIKKCEITYEDSVAIYRQIRKSKKRNTYTAIDSTDVGKVIVKDTTTKDSTYITSFRKNYNWGLVRLGISLDAVSTCPVEFGNYEIFYELDTILLKERYTVKETIILEPEVRERTITKFIAVPDKRNLVVGGVGMMVQDAVVSPVISTGIRTGTSTVISMSYATKLQALSLNISVPLFDIKQKSEKKRLGLFKRKKN